MIWSICFVWEVVLHLVLQHHKISACISIQAHVSNLLDIFPVIALQLMILTADIWYRQDPPDQVVCAHHLAPVTEVTIPRVVKDLSFSGDRDAQLLSSLVQARNYGVLHWVHVLQRERHVEVEQRICVVGCEDVVEKQQGTEDLESRAVVLYFLADKAVLHIDHQAVQDEL